jgi:hypothetical protein
VEAWRRVLNLVLQATWLLPLYVISLIVSCIWWAIAQQEGREKLRVQVGCGLLVCMLAVDMALLTSACL